MATIGIIDYGAGNLHSVASGFRRVMRTDDRLELVDSPEGLRAFSHIVLPGVGAYGDCISSLRAVGGMVEALEDAVRVRRTPFLGICVGMQMLFERGLEHGEHTGLGWMQGSVVKLQPSDHTLKIPHMGWNDLEFTHTHPATSSLEKGDHAYFVHSYHAEGALEAEILAKAEYGGPVVAMVGRDNLVGTQFHPEKSQQLGATVLANFLKMR